MRSIKQLLKDIQGDLSAKGKKIEPAANYDELRRQNSEASKEWLANEQAQAAQRFSEKMMASCSVDMAKNTLQSFVTKEPWQATALDIAVNVAHRAANVPLDQGFVFCLLGGYGGGKTHLGAGILNYAHYQSNKVILAQLWSEIVRDLWNSSESAANRDRVRNNLQRVDVLLIDEVGAAETALSPQQKVEFGELLRIRVNSGKVTVITSNHTMESLTACVGEFAINAVRQGGQSTLNFPMNDDRNQREPMKNIYL